jgi:hypothetical protein
MPEEARMELLLVICLVFVIVFALVQRKLLRALTSDYKALTNELEHNRAADNALFLNAAAQLYANELIRRDVEFFITQFQRLCIKANLIKRKGPESMAAHLKTITDEYPKFFDFWLYDLGFYYLPAVFEDVTNDELWELYEAIRLFEVMVKPLDFWKWQIDTDLEQELKRVKRLTNSN